jgi:hypothetical protein
MAAPKLLRQNSVLHLWQKILLQTSIKDVSRQRLLTNQTAALMGVAALLWWCGQPSTPLILIGGCKLEYIISISRLKEVFFWMLKIT